MRALSVALILLADAGHEGAARQVLRRVDDQQELARARFRRKLRGEGR